MMPGFAVAGFVSAAALSLVAATIHVLRLNAVNAPLVLVAIAFLVVGLTVHALSLEDDAPPVA
jgi:hypothetical protein